MNPLRFQSEMDYYSHIIEQFQRYETCGDCRGMELFMAKEINAILRELKVETQNVALMEEIVKNTIVLLLSLCHCSNVENHHNYCDLSDGEKTILRQSLTL